MKQLITTLINTIAILFLALSASAQQVISRTNTATGTNKSWQIFRQNSPGNVYGSSFVLFETNYDSILMHPGFVKIDILDNRKGFSPSKKFISANNNGYLTQGSFDSLMFPISQITNLNSMLTDRPTFSQSGSLYQPVGTYLIGADTMSINNRINLKLSTSNFNNTFDMRLSTKTTSDVSEGDNLYWTLSRFNSTFSTKSTTDLVEGSNLYFTNARVQTFGDTRYLQSEIDGSTTNEIELPAQSGQSGKVLTTNGSTPAWSNITLPNTGTSGTYGLVTTDAQGRVVSGKRQEQYTGTTNGSGAYTVTFTTAYSAAPNVQVAIQGDFPAYTAVVSSKSTTGFTVKVYTLSSILSLGLVPQYSPVPSVPVDMIVTEK